MNLTPSQRWLLEHVRECDGAEIPATYWPEAEALAQKGLVTVSQARGPDQNFKRVTPTKTNACTRPLIANPEVLKKMAGEEFTEPLNDAEVENLCNQVLEYISDSNVVWDAIYDWYENNKG